MKRNFAFAFDRGVWFCYQQTFSLVISNGRWAAVIYFISKSAVFFADAVFTLFLFMMYILFIEEKIPLTWDFSIKLYRFISDGLESKFPDLGKLLKFFFVENF